MTPAQFIVLEAMYFHVKDMTPTEQNAFNITGEIMDALLSPEIHKTKRERIMIEHEIRKKRLSLDLSERKSIIDKWKGNSEINT